VLLDERSELPWSQGKAHEIGGGDHRRRTRAAVDQRHFTESLTRPERPSRLAGDADRGRAFEYDEESGAFLPLACNYLPCLETPFAERVGEPFEVATLDAGQKSNLGESLDGVDSHGRMIERFSPGGRRAVRGGDCYTGAGAAA
jgi:hypothetical protein